MPFEAQDKPALPETNRSRYKLMVAEDWPRLQR
jgi:hypothetical protein